MTETENRRDGRLFEPMSPFQLFRRALHLFFDHQRVLTMMLCMLAVDFLLYLKFYDQTIEQTIQNKATSMKNAADFQKWVEDNPEAYKFCAYKGLTALGLPIVAMVGSTWITAAFFVQGKINFDRILSNLFAVIFALALSETLLQLVPFWLILEIQVRLQIPIMIIQNSSFLSSLGQSYRMISLASIRTCFLLFVVHSITGYLENLCAGFLPESMASSLAIIFATCSSCMNTLIYLNIRVEYEGLSRSKLCNEMGLVEAELSTDQEQNSEETTSDAMSHLLEDDVPDLKYDTSHLKAA